MRFRLAAAILVFFAGPALAEHAWPRLPNLDAVVAGVPEFAGLIAVSRDGVTVHTAAYGLRDRETSQPHAVGQTFRYASVSKMITAILVLQEVDRGTMALDAPLATYLSDSGVANADRITLRQLLAHRSGLAEQAEFAAVGADGQIADVLEYCRASAAEPGRCFSTTTATPSFWARRWKR